LLEAVIDVPVAPDRASVWYREKLTEIATYLREMEVPPPFFEIMKSISSTEVRWLSPSELQSLGRVPSFDEWLTAECGKNPDCGSSKLWRARDAIR